MYPQEDQVTNDVRLFTALTWLVGPTSIFVAWFLQGLISTGAAGREDSQVGLVLLYAFITSVPLILVSLMGAGACVFTDRLKTLKVLNTAALAWSLAVFLLYFGMFGAVGSLIAGGFTVSAVTIVFLMVTSVSCLVVCFGLFLFARTRITARQKVLAARDPLTYDI